VGGNRDRDVGEYCCTLRRMAQDDQRATAQAGWAAWQQGDVATARALFETVAAAGVATPALWLLLARARLATGAEELADQALDHVLSVEPRNVAALILKGDRAADDRAATSYYQLAVAQAQGAQGRDPATAALINQAKAKLAQISERFAEHLRAAVAAHPAGARLDEAVALLLGEKEVYLQSPTTFFFPGLPHRQFFPLAEFDWAADLMAATDAIEAELRALLAEGAGLAPYVRADPSRANRGHALLDDPRWSAFHLIDNGVPVAGAEERFPRTMKALARVPMPAIAARSPMALFSVLEPDTHIPPHSGMLNTRLICHLPLIVPAGCSLRVGNDVRPVERGKLMIFDDSIEHEAWNRSDATRVVLLFEIWRPELSAAERTALTRLFEAVGLYGGGQ